MSERDPGWWASLLDSIIVHRLGWFTGASSFIAAVFSGLMDGKSWARSSFGGLICVIIALGLIAALHAGGLYQSWWPLIGIFVGFIGAERIRDAILAAWETRKSRIVEGNNDENQR